LLRSIFLCLGLSLSTVVHAALSPGAFGPASNPAVTATPSYGNISASGRLDDNYIDFGVDFSFGGVEGYFSDTDIFAFGGVNSENILDLLTAVDGRIVILGSTVGTTTGTISVEAGYAVEGSLLLSAFDVDNVLIASVSNGAALGLNSRSLLTLTAPGIASFRISGTDTFGVAQISIGAASVPEPASWALLIGGFALIGQAQRRRRTTLA